MISGRLLVGLLLIAGVSLSACGRKNENDLTLTENPSSGDRAEDQFGKEFGKAYRADPNSQPANVSDGDVVPVSLDTEPVPID